MSHRESAPFGALLLRYRAAAHLTQEQLAARAGLSTDAVAALERGKRRTPRAATVELLADGLGLDAQERAQLAAAAAARASVGAPRTPPATEEEGGTARDWRYRRPWWLAVEPTLLVDRVHELDTIVRSLVGRETRLLTLVGPAGVGKTRLALAAAAQLAEDTDRFPDGVTLVDLTPVRDPDLVPGAIAQALGLLDIGSRTALERLVEALVDQRHLVVLDNVEQVLPAAAAALAELLAACPGLAVLATSRVPLRLRWEQTLRVAPLPVPDLSVALPPLDVLLAVPSVELFVKRARAHRTDFALGEKQAPLVAQLAVELDGLPLALELAAARLDVLPLPALARRLGDRLRLLASQAPDRPERQWSLEAAVGWSYDLLSEPERRLFRSLGVFAGRVSLDAITAVVGAARGAGPEAAGPEVAGPEASDGEAWSVREAGRTLPRLLSLAEKSLLLPVRPAELAWQQGGGEDVADGEEDEDQEPAFGMLETVRAYAEERLAAAACSPAASRAHARYFLALAERADHELHGPDQRAWFLRLERELDNLRAALRWLLDQDDEAERKVGLRLAAALGYFWYRRGYHAEGGRWLEEALARAPQAEEESADLSARIRALVAAGALLVYRGEFARARAVLEDVLAVAERRRDPGTAATALTYLGLCAAFAGEWEEAAHRLHEALRRWETLGDPAGLGQTLFYLGYTVDATEDVTAAAARYTAALRWLEAAGAAPLAGIVHSHLGVAEWRLGDLRSAVEHVRAALRIGVSLRDRWLLSFATQAAVALVGACAEPASQARLLGAADTLTQATSAVVVLERMPGAKDVAGLRERLTRGEGAEAAAYREGRTLPVGEAAALALRLLDEVARSLPQLEVAESGTRIRAERLPMRAERSPLTEREVEVMRLVAQGRSNKAIGQQLFLSPSTVNHHLTAIFNKLGVTTRAQAVAEAAQRGLL